MSFASHKCAENTEGISIDLTKEGWKMLVPVSHDAGECEISFCPFCGLHLKAVALRIA